MIDELKLIDEWKHGKENACDSSSIKTYVYNYNGVRNICRITHYRNLKSDPYYDEEEGINIEDVTPSLYVIEHYDPSERRWTEIGRRESTDENSTIEYMKAFLSALPSRIAY